MANSSMTGLLAPSDTGHGGNGGGTSGIEWGGNGARGPESIPQQVYVTGMGVAICGILMFFAALVSASVVRKGLGAIDWRPLELPRVLWLNTVILLASSLAVARARWSQLRQDEAGFRHWWNVATILGILFLAGQLIAWRQVHSAGLYLAISATAGFFYVFTGAHGLHLAGGVAALVIARVRPPRWLGRDTVTRVVEMYWHFLTVLWLFLLLFFLWEKYS
jgi:cytochrome c oxidase subunit III